MPKLTNPGKQPKGFHLPSTGELVELSQGQSAEVSAADLAKLKESPAFTGFEIEGEEDAGEPKPPAKKRGRKAKADAGDEKPDDGDDEGDNPDATGGE